MQTRSRQASKRRHTTRLLLELPDAAVEAIATFLPPTSMAHLQCTCKHLKDLLVQDRYFAVRRSHR